MTTGGSLKITDFLLLGGRTAEVETTVFRGRPLGRAGAEGAGTGWRGGRPRRGGKAGVSSSAVTAGFSRCTETISTLEPTWIRKVLRVRDTTL